MKFKFSKEFTVESKTVTGLKFSGFNSSEKMTVEFKESDDDRVRSFPVEYGKENFGNSLNRYKIFG